jgi:hypothetical protein
MFEQRIFGHGCQRFVADDCDRYGAVLARSLEVQRRLVRYHPDLGSFLLRSA